jgi:hypothetical protein
MTDSQRVYTKVLQVLKKLMPKHKQGHVVTLAMMISGIVQSGKAQLSAMSLEVPHPAKPKGLEKRFRRWVKNENVEKNFYYLPYARLLLAHLSNHPLTLVLDGSSVGRGCMAIMVCVVYRQRALPLAWLVYKGKKGHTTAERHIAVLAQLLPLLPDEAEVILLGDGEYDNPDLLSWIENETEWTFVVRSAANVLITHGKLQYPLAELAAPNTQTTASHVLFTAQEYGPVHAIAWWDEAYDKPIYLITNLANPQQACTYYQRRALIETLFSDQKSRGFHIHKSHLADPDRVARLLLASSLAYLWLIYLGLFVTDRENLRSLIDRTDRTDKSLFRLGYDWLKFALRRGKPFEVAFHLAINHC